MAPQEEQQVLEVQASLLMTSLLPCLRTHVLETLLKLVVTPSLHRSDGGLSDLALGFLHHVRGVVKGEKNQIVVGHKELAELLMEFVHKRNAFLPKPFLLSLEEILETFLVLWQQIDD